MKKIAALVISISSLFIFAVSANAQDQVNNLLKKLEVYTQKIPQEKIHLHLDKPYYAIGDDIWFKAYVVDGRTLEPTNISNVLYVELLGQDNIIKKQLKLKLERGVAWGDFKLADTLGEGNFRIRAYTQWMRNAGEDFFFDKIVKIGNSWTNDVFTQTTFTSFKKNGIEYTMAKVIFTNPDGKPIVGENINFEVRYNNKSLAKSTSKTNNIGEAAISFPSQKIEITKGEVLATLNLRDNKKQQNIFRSF